MKVLSPEAAADIRKDYAYEAVDTCAADSLCFLACPLRIDTGKFMKRFRAARHTSPYKAVMDAAAKGWGRSSRCSRWRSTSSTRCRARS